VFTYFEGEKMEAVSKIDSKIISWKIKRPLSDEEIQNINKEKDKDNEISLLEDEIKILKAKIDSLNRLEIVTANRESPLEGKGYKIEPSGKDNNAYYINITNVIHNGRKRVYEVFINTKNPKHQQWLTALTRLSSAIMRREENPLFIGEELSEAFDIEGGGYYRPGGKWFKGLADEIGAIITKHIQDVINENKTIQDDVETGIIRDYTVDDQEINGDQIDDHKRLEDIELQELNKNAVFCPSCKQKSYLKSGGCGQCTNCEFSECG